MASAFSVHPVRLKADLSDIALLFEAYSNSLPVDLGYQDFAAELAALPGKYSPPEGDLLLARDSSGGPVGCVALKPLPDAGICEMKRLYVSPAARGAGLGKALMLSVIAEARRIGYDEMWLDTLPTMAAAQNMYRDAGFRPMEPYYDTPVDGTLFLRLILA
ncbi:MAG: GNAT family N-acetyltransferase [Sphingosinicella sp.]|nr:GNAT family N-acetyltransferase [Sphingosinicella sp.]